DQRDGDHREPPSLPDGRQDGEGDSCRNFAHDAVGIDRPNQKSIAPRRQVCKVHHMLIGRRAPILIRSLELDLITQRLAKIECRADKSYLDVVLVRRDLRTSNRSLSDLRNVKVDTGYSQTGYENGRRGPRAMIELGDEP